MSDDRRAFRTHDGREYVIGVVNGRQQFVMRQPAERPPQQGSLWQRVDSATPAHTEPAARGNSGRVVELARATMITVF